MAELGTALERTPPEHPIGGETQAVSRNRRRGPTGPRTLAGKTRSKFNALRHGILSSATVLESESEKVYGSFVAELVEDLEPVGRLEETEVEIIASTLWRYQRLLRAEAAEIGRATVMTDKNFRRPSERRPLGQFAVRRCWFAPSCNHVAQRSGAVACGPIAQGIAGTNSGGGTRLG